MFERRVHAFWILLVAIALVIVGRLVQVQVVQAAEYEALAARILTRQPIYLAAPRGTIRDRNGIPLLTDQPSSDVAIHYALLCGDERRLDSYLTGVARTLRRRGQYEPDVSLRAIVDELRTQTVPAMWARLATLAGVPPEELADAADGVRRRVERVLRAVRSSNPTIREIKEQHERLPVVQDVHHDAALAIRLELEEYPWLRVVPSSHRLAHEADALVHVLGRLGAASAERIAEDPLREDELRGLRPGDRCGITGVERLAETSLRGQRGRILEDYDRTVLERIDPLPGHDVTLTIDLPLQQYVLELLEQSVKEHRDRTGAAAVVVDVASREVRALVSYPVYPYDEFGTDYDRLLRDAIHVPLRFRAVAEEFAPGSTCKAITLIAGLTEGVVSPHEEITCTGHLLPGRPEQFRCWIWNRSPGMTHGPQDAATAVRNSCNIFFFKVGDRLGAARLCTWFDRFGFGRTTGTGLIEESAGIVPTEDWLRANRERGYQASDAWFYAIGQGEVTATPLQVANVAATVAAGYWAPVRLAYDDTGHAFGHPPVPPQHFDERHLRVLRDGMWQVVNHERGTARPAQLSTPGHELCGKTGSAQAHPRAVAYRFTFEWPDGTQRSAVAAVEEDALEEVMGGVAGDPPRCVGRHTVQRYPPLPESGKLPSHAWFMGYTQSSSTPRGHAPAGKAYALAVVVEYGGSGGRVAGPLAKAIAEYALEAE